MRWENNTAEFKTEYKPNLVQNTTTMGGILKVSSEDSTCLDFFFPMFGTESEVIIWMKDVFP